MLNISLSQIFNNSKEKAQGYLSEAIRRGKIIENYLQISEDDYEYLSKNFIIGSVKQPIEQSAQQAKSSSIFLKQEKDIKDNFITNKAK